MGFRVEVSIQVVDDGSGEAPERVIWGAGRQEIMPPATDGEQACIETLGKVKELVEHAQDAVFAQGSVDLKLAKDSAALADTSERGRRSSGGGHR